MHGDGQRTLHQTIGAFIGVVFFFSTASGAVEGKSVTKRLLPHTIPALVFYVALMLRLRPRQTNTAPLYT